MTSIMPEYFYLKNRRYVRGDEERTACEIFYEANDLKENRCVQIRKLNMDMVRYRGLDPDRATDRYYRYAALWNQAAREYPEGLDSVTDFFVEQGEPHIVINRYKSTEQRLLDIDPDPPLGMPERWLADDVMHIGSRALEELHKQGLLVLRFENMENFYRDVHGKVRLGFYFAPEQLTRPVVSRQDAWMSSHFAAPEVYLGKPLSPAADVYALSALVYSIATRVNPDKSLFRLYGNLGLPVKEYNGKKGVYLWEKEVQALTRGLSLNPEDRQQSVR